MRGQNRSNPAGTVENRLRGLRLAKGLSQSALAEMAGITRQAIYAIEANQYLPTTAVALRLAGALECRVEDLFSLVSEGEVIEGDWIGSLAPGAAWGGPARVKVARIGERVLVRPVASLGDVLNFTVAADGLVVHPPATFRRSSGRKARVQVQLLRDRRLLEADIVVAGCDPAMFLVGEHLRRRQSKASVVGWSMGSAAAIEALNRREVHVAGLHVVDAKSGEYNLPYLRRHLRNKEVAVVTFVAWEQGLMVRKGNPKRIREVADLARKDVTVANREEGAGARLLLDRELAAAGIRVNQVKGYRRIASSHLEVARWIADGQVDVGMGVQSAARLLMLDFIPLQHERYDLVIPSAYLGSHPSLS
ncbi:MAG: helix-turn-helix domain-containing protein, partial [Nitrospirae bacterium]|nr:helix-turn-helix domain-containing protein [Nitrospirota bacterium]